MRLASGECAKTIVVNAAVSGINGQLEFSDTANSARERKHGGVLVNAVKIDDYCNSHNIVPSFIKMDIEGSELSALHGAEETIKKFKPRLAICVYHKPWEDLWAIPYFIKECVPSYKLYLKKSHYVWESVLFAVP